MSDEDEDAGESTEEISPATTVSEIPEQREKPEPFVGARPVDEVFDRLNPATGRLLIRGVAGGGKSTLLRWASIQAAKFNLENHDTRGDTAITTRDVATCEVASMGDIQKVGISATAPEVDNTLRSRPVAVDEILNPRRHNWRTKIPFLIRLRDCPEGALPRPKDLPALIAKELPDPPPEWIDQILKSGRALLLFDGVDEIPSDKRELLAREIENLINEYPDNYCIVSTRPGAVDRGWLSKLNFFEARIEPMSTDDQDEFIDKWYSAVSAELRASGRRAENLDKLSTSLKQELRDTPGIAKLAIYPLLCAMICALYRERNQKLPETQAALCEDLCKMLLHRRERETPDMKLIHLPPDYRKLDYEHKKYIVAELAKIMVEKGVSSLDETEADNLLKLALQHFPDHANSSPQQMRRALVERSGLLRPSGANRIDFLHNTLKEYLAAGRFVMDDAYKLLANHAEDDTWQPVILFAAALPTPGFASKLMRELLKPVQRGNFLAEQQETVAPNDTATAPPKRNQEFFVVRCRNAAFRLDPDLVTKVNRLASGLFPPNTIADAEALASLGEAIIPHLDPKQRLGTRQKVACIRALRLVGGPKAKTLFRRFPPGKAKSVLLELLGASADLGTAIKLTNDSLDLSSTSIRNLSPLKGQAVLRFLELADTRVSDLTPIASLTKLHHLNIARTPVNDLAPLSTLTSLQSLDLTGTRVLDFTPLAKLSELQVLHMGRSRPSPYMPYDYRMHPYMASDYVAYLNKLTEDDILERAADYNVRFYHGRIRSIRGFAESIRSREEQLERLFEDSPTHSGKQFATLVRLLSRANLPMEHGLYSLAPALIQLMANYPHIPERLLSEMQDRIGYHLVDSENFERWLQKELEHLTVRGTKAIRSMLAPLSGLQKLRVLSLDGLPVYDLSALSTLKRLRFLGLSSTCAADLSPLTRLRELRWLDLSGCPTSDISALHGHVDLRVLNLSVTEISDLSPLIGSMTLRVLNLVGSKVSDFSPLFRLPSLRTLIVARHSAGDRKSRANQSRQLAELKRACPELEIHRLV
ncbi:MAG: NACHT domain-containing protein [Verrucomicrobiia bacterium]